MIMDINVEKKKRGRKPKTNPQVHRYMFRLNDADNKRLLSLYEQSGKRSISAFLADCVLNNPVKTVLIDKSAIDFVMLLSAFFAQFRAIKNNFNQVYDSLVKHFGEQKALEMIQLVAQSTRKFGLLKQEIEGITAKLRELCLPK
jgi:hypothetical protein